VDLDDSSVTDGLPAVDAGFVGAREPAVETVEVESEALLYYPDRTDRVAVNAGTALIWACLDGESTLGEIAADLAESFNVPFETMLADVTAAVSDFVLRGMVRDARQPSAAAPEASPAVARPLADSDFPLGDEGTLGVQIGGKVVGVRSNDPVLLSLLRGALAPIVVDGERATPRLSLLVTPDRGRVAGLCFLYRDDDVVFRSASRGRAVRATLAHLDRFLAAPEGTIRVDAHVLVGNKGAVLVGGAFLEMLELAGPYLASMGWQVVDGPAAVIDREDFSAVVNPPRIALDPVGIAAIDAGYPLGRDEATRPGRHEITTVIVVGGEHYPAEPESPSQRLAVLLPLVTWAGTRIQRADVEWLWQLATHVGDIRWLFSTDDQELPRALAVLAGRMPRPALALPR
jgi:hypothetical protein